MKEVSVKILGKHVEFNIPDSLRREDFLEIVAFVEKKINEIRKETDDLDSFKLGLLASINIAEEYFSLKKENERLRMMLDKIDSLVSASPGEGAQQSIRITS
ncbi:MAG: cell division protein ZapA [Candidatus Aminicenantes bacterium]|nr:cell division protein ZapA [Candidatus Aminicenantes bacterium]